MNTDISNTNVNDNGAPDRDVILTRLVDARASDADWSALRSMAANDASVWADLAASQRQAAMLVHATAPALALAERTALPDLGEDHALPMLDRLRPWAEQFVSARSARLGWAIAAMIALAWTASVFAPRTPGLAGNTAGLGPVLTTPEAALNSYLDLGRKSGRVVGELPDRVVLESRALADGKFEVLYLRRFIERATVDSAYRLGELDTGDSVLIPAQPRTKGASDTGPGL